LLIEHVWPLTRPAFENYLQYISLQLTYPDLKLRKDDGWRQHLARLRQHAKGRTGKDASYRVLSRAINAADYGAPQKRHRAIFIGIGSEYGDDWCFPEATHSREALAWSKHVERDYWERHRARRLSAPASDAEAQALKRVLARSEKPKERPWTTVRDAISDLPPPTKSEKVAGHWQHLGARAYDNHTGSCLDEPAKALKAGDHGVPGGENMLADGHGDVRYFTFREMARLQGFPDDFFVSGTWVAATRQLGNAVPTMVGEYMGKAVSKIIAKKACSS
jgi:DNA (cytosine-5)-methyltransferase 1